MTFNEIQQRAAKRKGGQKALKALLPKVLSAKQLAKVGDDRMLAMMARTINQAGFNWSVIEKKWPEFEEAFYGFNLQKLSLLSPEQWEAYTDDKRIVRHWPKIKAVMENVGFVCEEASKHGSFATFIASWPADDQIGLLQYLKKRGSRLGGNTGQWFLRYIGKDGFVLTRDVVLAMQTAGLEIADNPTSLRDLRKVQGLMNQWHDETQLPYTHLSKIAAFSIGENYFPPSQHQ